MAPPPEDDGRNLGDQQAWTSEQRHALIRIIVTVHRWIAETGGRSTGTDLQ
jgi:hypothetical protein